MLTKSLQGKSSWGSSLSSVPDKNLDNNKGDLTGNNSDVAKLTNVYDKELKEWDLKLQNQGDHFKSTLDMQNKVHSTLRKVPVRHEEAFCALVDAKGDINTAVEALNDPGYFHKIRSVCNLYDVQQYAKNIEGTHKKPDFDVKKQVLSVPLPNISLPQWTPDRRVLEQVKIDSLSPFEKLVLDQDFSNRRLMQGASTNGLPSKDSFSMDKQVEYYMQNYESQHIREWSRAKQSKYMNSLIKSPKPTGMNRFKSPHRSPSKKHTLLSPLGHDGVIPVVKKPAWRPLKSPLGEGIGSPVSSVESSVVSVSASNIPKGGALGSTTRRSIAL